MLIFILANSELCHLTGRRTQVIGPFLIIQRVADQTAVTSNALTSGNVGSIHFKSRGESTVGNGILGDGDPMSSMDTDGEIPGELGIGVEGIHTIDEVNTSAGWKGLWVKRQILRIRWWISVVFVVLQSSPRWLGYSLMFYLIYSWTAIMAPRNFTLFAESFSRSFSGMVMSTCCGRMAEEIKFVHLTSFKNGSFMALPTKDQSASTIVERSITNVIELVWEMSFLCMGRLDK